MIRLSFKNVLYYPCSFPDFMMVLSSTVIVGCVMMPSAWNGTSMVPPKNALFPNAMWQVPSTFSSSNTEPVMIAFGLVPIPNSATFRCSFVVSFSSSCGACFPFTFVTSPCLISIVSGSSSFPMPAILASIMSFPLVVPSTGARKTSPAGRLPTMPFLRIPVSGFAVLFLIEQVRSVPRSVVMVTWLPSVSRLASLVFIVWSLA